MKKFYIPFIFFLTCCNPIFSFFDREYIESFHSDITVHKDASISVTETIVYVNNAKRVRGIFRDFPLLYKNIWGIRKRVGFDVVRILRNGEPEHFKITRVEGVRRIYIGRSEVYLPCGRYTYQITYKTTRQLLFFDKHDELYWNVNGTQWRFPLKKVSATVTLPDGVLKKDIHVEGYTGKLDQKGQDYNAWVAQDNKAYFETTRPVSAKENLTIVVTWPKGFVKEPSRFENFSNFLKDNGGFLLAILLFLLFLIYNIYLWVKLRATQKLGTIIPLFYPPEGVGPAAVRYISKFGYDERVLAAEVVNMAVKGLLAIKYDKGAFWGGTYSLIAKEIPKDKEVSSLHATLYDIFFTYSEVFKIDRKNRHVTKEAVDYIKKTLRVAYKSKCFLDPSFYFVFNFASALFFVGAFFLYFINVGFLMVAFIVALIFRFLLKGYTPEGLKLKNEIEGFKLFLKTTEEDRLKVIGTPPTKTPELYEKYLPYAIALGVEKQWSKKFAPVFKELEKRGTPYTPIWYVGMGRFTTLNADTFVSDLTGSLSSSSGKGGRGGSGRGGGGGGGGSW